MIQKNRIRAVRPSSQLKIPPGAKVFDLKGKVAIPGLIDVHAHMHYGSLSIHPQQHWAYKVNLSYGVTTVHDPSASTELVFSYAERIRAGQMIGPRVFSTGFILYGAENSHKAHIRNYKHALRHIRRLKTQGAISVKSYMQPTRQQRQWVLQAAKKEKILVYPEGGGYLEMNLSMVLDGHTGIEHALPVAPLYRDVIQLMARSRTGYTPTLLVGYGGIWGENYFYQQAPIWNDPRLRRFLPRRRLRAKTLRRSVLVLDNNWHHKQIALAAKRIVRAGGKVQIGSHGQLQGLGYHWEMKALRHGGLSNREVLKAATIDGAYYLGLEKELGSIEKGKLADILILNKNPLKNLDHAKNIFWVIHNGVIRRSSDLRKVLP